VGTIHLGTEYAAPLVGAEYRPPATVESLPPRGGTVLAVAVAKGSGTWVRDGDETKVSTTDTLVSGDTFVR
jgi:hypothetical protein